MTTSFLYGNPPSIKQVHPVLLDRTLLVLNKALGYKIFLVLTKDSSVPLKIVGACVRARACVYID